MMVVPREVRLSAPEIACGRKIFQSQPLSAICLCNLSFTGAVKTIFVTAARDGRLDSIAPASAKGEEYKRDRHVERARFLETSRFHSHRVRLWTRPL